MTTPKRVAIGAVVLALTAAAFVALYLGGWWLRADRVDREVGITNRNTGVQTAWRDEVTDLIATAGRLPEGPQREALHNQACDLIGRLTSNYLDDRIVAFNESECM